MAETPERRLSVGEVGELRRKTEAISAALQARLAGHLETLLPLLAPRRLLGKYLGGGASRDEVPGADKALESLEEAYRKAAGKPFLLRPDLARDAVSGVENRPELYPWEYDHSAEVGGESRTIQISSPVRWVLTYASDYDLSQVRQVASGSGEKRPDDLRQFIVNTLVMKSMLERFDNLTRVFSDLRFDVSIETPPDLGGLPLVVLSSHLASFRPSDELIVGVTQLSGVNEFIELVDDEALAEMRDPLRDELARIVG